ncbi:SDR family oxidoreductase [Chloroflexota bacterium]
MTEPKLILITGATGYVGGRLVPKLLEAGYRVRCLVRDPSRLQGRAWLKNVEVAAGDALNPQELASAMKDVSVAYYLMHGKQGGKLSAERDIQAAHNFARAAEEEGIEQIIYFGELVDPTADLSPYLRSRHETGFTLRHGKTPVTEIRAGMIIGSGSALFEMIRYLTEREPILICPAWFFSYAQPIAIRDVITYLVDVLKTPDAIGRVIEVGGPSRLTYADMLLGYAKVKNLRRWLIRTPFYASRLSAYWVHMVTPIHWRVVAPLIEGLRAQLIVRDETAKKLFPQIQPTDFQTAVQFAVSRVQRDDVETSWSNALVTEAGDVKPYVFTVEEGLFIERRRVVMDLSPELVFRAYTGIGGERGWLYMDWSWALRGWIDKAIGGVGLRRGRRHPDEIHTGEALDFWRVEAVEENRLMRLRAEMIVPGKAWLQFESVPLEDNRDKTLFTVTAYFEPHGLPGFLYWYAMWPFHKFIFDGLARQIASRARVLEHTR